MSTPTTTPTPATVEPRKEPAKGLPWLIMGSTVLLVALVHLAEIPAWVHTQTLGGLTGNITGAIVLLGVAATLITVGVGKRR